MTMASPPRRGCLRNAIILIVVLVVVVGGIVYAVLGPVLGSLGAVTTTSNNFLTALVAKDYGKAYGMVHPSQQTSFGGSADGMQQLFTTSGLQPSAFSVTNVQVATDGIASGSGTFDGTTKYFHVDMRKDGDTWKVIGFFASPNPPTATPSS